MNRKSKKKNRWDFVRKFTCDSRGVCGCVCLHVCAFFLRVVVAYYCVCMCEWYIVYVYTKVYAQCVVFTGC